jgi:hypothetical protein
MTKYICKSCGCIIKKEELNNGIPYVFGGLCPACKKADQEDAKNV